jgi:hypothetical protein
MKMQLETTASSSVGANSAADCISPASGAPVPSYGFHHGAFRSSTSSAARWPSACEVNPSFGSTDRSPGSGPALTELASPLRSPIGSVSTAPTRYGKFATSTTAAIAIR